MGKNLSTMYGQTGHVFRQQDTYISEEIWKEGGTIDLFLGDIYYDMEWDLMCFRQADEKEFKELMKDTIVSYIYDCQLRNGGKY